MSKSGQSGRTGEFFVLAEALRAFKTGPLSDDPSDRALAKAAGVSPTTIGDWLRGRRFPQDIGKVLRVVGMVRNAAAARGIASPADGPAGLLDNDRWRAAHREEARRRANVVSDEVQRAQAAAVLAGPTARVREVDPRRLGVHAAISVPGVPDEVLPEYVPRDADAAEFGVRARVAAAAERGGFVLLVGGSSVGKTRSAAEAVRSLLPDWWLVHPAGPAQVAALAAAPILRVVVWLDELQRYLDGEHGLTAGVVRALLGPPHPAVIIGTLWPDRYTAYTTVPALGGADLHARERQVLDLAAIIRIGAEFSPAEQNRARAAAARDRRLALALESAGYGLTQTLAAAPQLVACWEDAKTASPYGWAVLTAALDATRLGARAPLSADLLRAAAVDYCTSQQQAEAPENWFEQALAYATTKLHGAVAALSPASTGIMGRVAGYTVADYLIQYASRERRFARVPASTWDALAGHIRDPADAAVLGESASRRLLHRHAIPLYRLAADAGYELAAVRLAGLLRDRGDLDGAERVLRDMADTDGTMYAAGQQARLLRERGDLDGLSARADADDWYAAYELAELLRERGDLDGLRARADAGDECAAEALARLLRERGDLDGLRARADAGDGPAVMQLAYLLEERGDLDGAERVLRARPDADDGYAAIRLAYLLEERGDLDGAERVLRARADAGDEGAAMVLAYLLEERGDLDGAERVLRAWADDGDERAAVALARLLEKRGDPDGLRARADAGDGPAAVALARLLEKRGDPDGAAQVLLALVHADNGHAANVLVGLLVRNSDLDGAERVERALADAGDGPAAVRLAYLLEERGDLDAAERVLLALADADNWYATEARAELLIWRGRHEEAERVRRSGLNPDG